MKRTTALLLAAILCLCLAACGKAPEPEQSPQEPHTEANDTEGTEEKPQSGSSSPSGNEAEKPEAPVQQSVELVGPWHLDSEKNDLAAFADVKGYAKAARRFDICAVCAVGLCDTGTLTDQVRKVTSIPEGIPLFTLQGGIDRSRLKGMDKLMISMLTKGLASQKQRSAQEERMLELLSRDESYVSSENIAAVLQWYREEQL